MPNTEGKEGEKVPPDKMDTNEGLNAKRAHNSDDEISDENEPPARKKATMLEGAGEGGGGVEETLSAKSGQLLGTTQTSNTVNKETLVQNKNTTTNIGNKTQSQTNSNMVIRVTLVGESKENYNFDNARVIFNVINNSIFQKKIIQDSLQVVSKKCLRFEVPNLDTKEGVIDLKQITKLGNWDVKCERPKSDENQNCCYGTIKGVNLDITNEEMMQFLRVDITSLGEYMEPHNPIKEVERIHKRIDGKITPTESVKITFSGINKPRNLRLWYTQHRVFPFIYDINKCKFCKEYGHLSYSCKKKYRCYNCSEFHEKPSGPNANYKCSRNPYCFHCKGKHRPHSKECKVQQKAIEINKNNISPNNLEVKSKLKELNRNPWTYINREQNTPPEVPKVNKQNYPTLKNNPSSRFSQLKEVNIDEETIEGETNKEQELYESF